MTDSITDSGLTSGNGSSPYLTRYRYVPKQTGGVFENDAPVQYQRISNINPAAVAEFQTHYSDANIDDDDLFYYVYGVLHSEQYRQTFVNDLTKSPAHIPMAATLADFRAFVAAGLELGELHVGYETVEPYPLEEVHAADWDADAPNSYRVEKMKYGGNSRNPDKSRIVYNARITLAGIPPEAHQYILGNKSALDWLIERYKYDKNNKTGIVNDPNDWAAEHDQPRYILDLVKRITRVSVDTVAIVKGLPELPV